MTDTVSPKSLRLNAHYEKLNSDIINVKNLHYVKLQLLQEISQFQRIILLLQKIYYIRVYYALKNTIH